MSAALQRSGLTSSTSEALRMIQAGGIRLDGEKIENKALVLLIGSTVVLQRGKKDYRKVTVCAAS